LEHILGRGRKQAQALVIAVIVVAVCFAMGAGFLGYSRVSYMINQGNMNYDAAYYLAQSGLEIARYQLSLDFINYTGTASPISFSSGTINITVGAQDASGIRQVISTGVVGNAQQQITRKYKQVSQQVDAAWAFSPNKLNLLTADSHVLITKTTASNPAIVAADPVHQTAWYGDWGGRFLWKIDNSGNTQQIDFGGSVSVPSGEAINQVSIVSIGINISDGSCFVSGYRGDRTKKFNFDTSPGPLLLGARSYNGLAVNSSSGECFEADMMQLQKYGPAGNSIGQVSFETYYNNLENSMAVNSQDNSVWVLDYHGYVYKYDTNFNLLGTRNTINATSLGVNPIDGSAWVIDNTFQNLLKLSPVDLSTQKIINFPGSRLSAISINPVTGSVWVVNGNPTGTLYMVDSQGNNITPVNFCLSFGGNSFGKPIAATTTQEGMLQEMP